MNIKILLIDDDTIGNMLTSTILEDMPHIGHLEIVTSGREAIEYLKKKESEKDSFPDLIFVDIKMPEIDGFELIEICESKFNEIKNSKRFVVLSSSVREKDRTQAMSYDSVIDFVSKPLTDQKIAELSEFVLKQQGH